MRIETYPDFEMMAINVAQRICGDLKAALDSQDRVLLAVPGGTTPGPIFDDLCAADLDWSRVDIILTDERWVPGDHERSNTKLLKERLLVNRATDATLLPLYVATDEPEEGLPQLIPGIEARLPIAVAVLGMGADMHTASLFPDSAELDAALAHNAPALIPVRPESQPEARITLAAHVLNGALHKHVVFKGQDKRDALDKAMTLPPQDAPIRAVLDGATVHYSEN
ncbi:6-phosphogluconolactonase [Cognatishimia activa]|uniref:6-phosphogluconolactonase n=1 Tax=Cognatishimia activa TaxID=1715691 RepID=A0A0P1INX3_9RHOB|nr:6-phosphogluconolactonase [Cognatishimia activa]CUJ27132.1 6-phosphogluconolactonase [Cognatishimia activa]CUK25289.1 6-phosphogluconolactonase [Cognatishimia activa]